MDSVSVSPARNARCGKRLSLSVDTQIARALPNRALVIRWLLVPVFVIICFQFQWQLLREWTTTAILLVSQWIHLPLARINTDVVELTGIRIKFTVSCTFIDAFCGSIPLLWNLSSPIAKNGLRLLLLYTVIFFLNIARLEGGFVAIAAGVPWWLAHECVSGMVYFLFLVFIIGQRAWANQPGRDSRGFRDMRAFEL
jgi:hypothetical protein